MKSFKYFLIAAATIVLAACSGGDSMSPTSEKIQGPLGEFFEVVTKDYKAKDGKVSVEIKRIKAGFPEPWKEGMAVGYSDGQVEPGFTIEFQDADGNVVSKDKTDIVSDKDELNAIASLSVDESATITFDCKEGTKQFRLGSTFESHGEVEKTVNLGGSIGPYPIMMTMHIAADGKVTGAYYYKRIGRGNYLYIKGEKSDDKISLNEFTKDGQQTGTFEGVYQDDVFKGRMDAKSGSYDFVLKPTEMETINFDNIDFNSFHAENTSYNEGNFGMSDDDYSSGNSGSYDWDSMLNSYEQYVDKYISLMKKAAKGDMSALAEYPEFMQKAEEISKKIDGAKGNMSASQLSRYMKINNKMLKAAQEMQ